MKLKQHKLKSNENETIVGMRLSKGKKVVMFICLLAIPVLVGMLSSLITGPDMSSSYTSYEQPPFAPPSALFPIMWTILYILMGISSYLIVQADVTSRKRNAALTVYAIQLIVNFFWSILFFKMGLVLISFFWIILLWLLVLLMIIVFRRISKAAGWLQLPYIIWLTIAAYLNLGIYLLN